MIERMAEIMLSHWWIVGIILSAFILLMIVSLNNEDKYRNSTVISIYCGLLSAVCCLISLAHLSKNRLGEGYITAFLSMTVMVICIKTYATRNDPPVQDDPYPY